MSNQNNKNIKLRELTDEELEQVSGGWSWGASQSATVVKPLLGDDIGVPARLRRPIKGMESIEDDE